MGFLKEVIGIIKKNNPINVSCYILSKLHEAHEKSLNEGLAELLNYFLSKNSVSDTLIPSMIVEEKVEI